MASAYSTNRWAFSAMAVIVARNSSSIKDIINHAGPYDQELAVTLFDVDSNAKNYSVKAEKVPA